MRLKGKRALITGAARGIGRAFAEAYIREGAEVVIGDINLPAAQATAEEIGATAQALDVTDQASIDACMAVMAAGGGIDILINNAALIINRPFESFSIAEYEDQIRVNSSAAFVLAQAAAPGMKAKGYGKIVNFCSITLIGRWDGYVPYVASKGAMLGLTKTLSRELGPHGVRVNAVSPGAVVSEAEARVYGDRLQQYNDWILENQAVKARIEPRHIADLVLFLVSPASDMISGQNIAIDGGW